jgi:hypothetical protein
MAKDIVSHKITIPAHQLHPDDTGAERDIVLIFLLLSLVSSPLEHYQLPLPSTIPRTTLYPDTHRQFTVLGKMNQD